MAARGRAIAALVVTCAFDPRSALAQPTPAASVWYRSSEQCPDGASFLARLERRGVHARLARAGDHVDFVVTLGSEGGPSGTLERQTQAGTVSIRELRADGCEEVADALALSLALTFDPETTAPAATARPHADPSVPAPSPRGAPERDHRTPSPRAPDERALEWAAGAEVLIATGVAPGPMPGVGIFVELASAAPGVLSPALRLTLHGARSSTTTSRGDVTVELGAVRLEGCPIVLRASAFDLRPCAGADAGIIAAEGTGPTGTTDDHAWLDLAADARARWAPTSGFAVEAQVGGLVPITRYAIGFDRPSEVVDRTAPLAFQAALGAAVRWR